MRHLRTNARETLTKMSRKTGIPVSSIYEQIKEFEGAAIKKHTCLLDFQKIGYDLRVTLLLKAKPSSKQDLQRFLSTHHQVNTVLRINNGYDFLAEVLFRNMSELQDFMDRLEELGVRERKEYYILEELQRESFLTSEAHMEILAKN